MDVPAILVGRSKSNLMLDRIHLVQPDKKPKGAAKNIRSSSAWLVACDNLLPSALRRLSGKKVPLSTLLAEIPWPQNLLRQLKKLTPTFRSRDPCAARMRTLLTRVGEQSTLYFVALVPICVFAQAACASKLGFPV